MSVNASIAGTSRSGVTARSSTTTSGRGSSFVAAPTIPSRISAVLTKNIICLGGTTTMPGAATACPTLVVSSPLPVAPMVRIRAFRERLFATMTDDAVKERIA